ncbi:MAG: hypothetical protein LC126_25530 [Bryobacterales bacterium]|nr:hypothetical protein [Bryobacterales bacterium]
MNHNTEPGRRAFLRTGGAALTTSLLAGRVRGSNGRIRMGFIGAGVMGTGNLGHFMGKPDTEAAALCDVYQPNLERAAEVARKGRRRPETGEGFSRRPRG